MHRGLVDDSGRSAVQWSGSVERDYKRAFCECWYEKCEPAMSFVRAGMLNVNNVTTNIRISLS